MGALFRIPGCFDFLLGEVSRFDRSVNPEGMARSCRRVVLRKRVLPSIFQPPKRERVSFRVGRGILRVAVSWK